MAALFPGSKKQRFILAFLFVCLNLFPRTQMTDEIKLKCENFYFSYESLFYNIKGK